MIEVNGDLPDHVFALLDGAMGVLRQDMDGRGGPPLGMRTSQIRLLSLTPEEGMRVTALAQRVGMTAQALGEFVRDLEAMDVLEVVPDPADRRARIVRPTAKGRRAAEESEQAIKAMEAAWRDRIGPRRWDAMRKVLLEVRDRPWVVEPDAEG